MSMMKAIPGFDGYYIDETGVIESRKRSTPKTLSQVLNGDYLITSLMKGTTSSNQYVHRLVAETFIPNPEKHKVVNHINGDKLDNRVDNLEWCSSQTNTEKALAKTYTIKTPNGEELVITNLKKFCQENELHPRSLQRGYSSKGYKLV